MKLIYSLCLAAGATAQLGRAGLRIVSEVSFEARQVQAIINVVNGIETKAVAVDTALKAGNLASAFTASAALNNAIASAITTVNGLKSISVTDAVELQPVSQTLTTTVNETIKDIISKKAEIVAAGQGGAVSALLSEQLQSSKQLAAAIDSKLPTSLAPVAAELSAQANAAIQIGVDAFQGTSGSKTGGVSTATSSATPTVKTSGVHPAPVNGSTSQFTGAASTLNKIEGYGLAAFIAAIFAI